MEFTMATETENLKAPFPYFGGKASVASDVWAALGDVAHYIEPFFGSGAVLLARPQHHTTKMETVNDLDAFVANVWRAIQHDPDEVAKWCDWPVNHCDLSARKRRLIANEARLKENLAADADWFDAKLAGYWVYSASCWIGSGLTLLGQRPHVSDGGAGVHALGQIPHVGDGGTLDPREPYNTNIYAWMRRLSERLRYVRVVCGQWTQVCGGNWQDSQGVCGMFFDPPYGAEDRDTDVYHHDSTDVAHAVREWCLQRGSNPRYRIVLAGYDEHSELEQHGWTVKAWKAQGGYANIARSGETQGKANRHRECLYFSPHCLREPMLFE